METFLNPESQVCQFLMTREVEEKVVERFRYEKVCRWAYYLICP